MDHESTVPTPIEPASAVSETNPKKSGKSKALLSGGGVLAVIVIAGATYGVLGMTTVQKAHVTKQTATVKKVDTPETIDEQVQSYMQSEQKIEDALSDSESQAVVDDVNATQGLENNYDNL
jgi:hypothetical protein